MRKYSFIIIVLFLVIYNLNGKEKEFAFSQESTTLNHSESSTNQIIEKITEKSLHDKIRGIVFMSVSSIPIGGMIGVVCATNYEYQDCLPYFLAATPLISLACEFLFFGGASLFVSYQRTKSLKDFNQTLYYKNLYKVTKIIGIITLGTSIFPLSSMIPYIAELSYCLYKSGGTPAFFMASVGSVLALIWNSVIFVGHLIIGGVLFGYGRSKLLKMQQTIVTPEISLSHNKKEKNPLYGNKINLGLKVRI